MTGREQDSVKKNLLGKIKERDSNRDEMKYFIDASKKSRGRLKYLEA